MSEIYFSGDPATDSARRHLERVLSGSQRQKWGWLAAAMAGATAFTMWRVRRARQEGHATRPAEQPSSHDPAKTAPTPIASGRQPRR